MQASHGPFIIHCRLLFLFHYVPIASTSKLTRLFVQGIMMGRFETASASQP